MNYYKYLNLNRDMIAERLETIFEKYRVEFLSQTYDDFIVMKDKLPDVFREINELGIIVKWVSWWCYVDPACASQKGCPHGMGGPSARFVDGWFSELQNDWYAVDEHTIERLIFKYDRKTVQRINNETLAGIYEMLKQPFKYQSADFIEGNDCVTPSLWLLVPKDWRRSKDS